MAIIDVVFGLGAGVGPPDNFTSNVTEPTALNTGCRISEGSLAVHNGNYVCTRDDELVVGKRITGNILPGAYDRPIFRDCIIEMGPAPTYGTTLSAYRGLNGSVGGLVEFCTVRPSAPSVDIYGPQGGDFTFNRCNISGTVDGFSLNGSGTVIKTVRIKDSYIHDLVTYAVDPRQGNGPTHNDGIQAFGLLDLWVSGCAIYGGRTSCMLIQQQSGTYTKALCEYLWLYGNPTEGSTFNTSENGRGVINNLTLRFSRVDRAGNVPRILIATATKNAATTEIHDIVFMDDDSPVPISNGG